MKKNRCGPKRKTRGNQPYPKSHLPKPGSQRELVGGQRVLIEMPSGVSHGTVLETNAEHNRLTVVVDGDDAPELRIYDFQLNSERVRPTTIIDEIAELNKEL